MSWIDKIRRKLVRTRLRPIRVFCFHHVSAEYNPLTMWECDWLQLDEFKAHVNRMQEQGYTFISLEEAHRKLIKDLVRRKKYATLTFDDGYASLKEVLPWLEEQHIPVTIFVNTRYLDKQSWSSLNEEQAKRANPDVDMRRDVCPDLYLSKEELFAMTYANITVGIHGHEHLDATKLSIDEYRENIKKCRDLLMSHPRYIPYAAYTWGRHNDATDAAIREMGLIPVLVNGTMNYTFSLSIDRECIYGKDYNYKKR